MQEKDKKRLRFNYDDDVILLREVTSRNPFAHGCASWEEIKCALLQLLEKDFSVKSIRQHVQMLLDQWKKKDGKNQKSSGIELYSEKDVLLREVHHLSEEEKTKKTINKTLVQNKKAQSEIGTGSRQIAALNLMQPEEAASQFPNEHDYLASNVIIKKELVELVDNEVIIKPENPEEPKVVLTILSSSTSEERPGQSNDQMTSCVIKNNNRRTLGPIKNLAKKTNYIRRCEYLKEKNVRAMELEEKKLKLEERKVAVAERNIALAEKKFDFESEQFKKIIDNQQALINNLLNMIQK